MMKLSKLATSVLPLMLAVLTLAGSAVAQDRNVITIDNCSITPLYSAKVASDRPGVLELVSVEEGDQVKAGQLIGRLRDDLVQAAVETARKHTENDIDIRLAEKTNEVAEAEHEQAVQANVNPNLQVVTRYELRRLKLSAEQTALQIEQAKHEAAIKHLELQEATERLKEYQIESPLTGMVVRRYKTEGEAVQQGTEIVEVVDYNTLKVEGFINVTDSWDIRVGDPVVVRLEESAVLPKRPDLSFNGKIRFIDGAVTPVTQRIRVWAEVQNDRNFLLPGLRATMEIQPPADRQNETANR